MAQTIKLKRSSVASNIPTTGQLSLGEIAVNTNDGKLFIKKDDGAESIVEIGGANTLNELTDVVIGGSPLVSGQVLTYNGTSWINDDADYVELTGDTMTGILQIDLPTGSAGTHIELHAAAAGSPAIVDVENEFTGILSYDSAGIELGRYFAGRQRTGLQIRDNVGAVASSVYLLDDGNIFATAGTPGSDFPATPTLDVHLANKKFVDDTTVALDGSRTMTGNLTLISGVGTSVYVQPTTDSGSFARFVVKDAAGINRGKMEIVGGTGEMKFDLLNSSSVIINQLYMRTNGNVALTQATVPTSDDHLTRKDYVDDSVIGLSAQSGNATNTDLDGNPTQTNTLTANVSLTTSNRVAGRHVDVFYLASGADRTVTLNASWKSFGEASPITVPSGKQLIVTLVALGTAETDIQAVCVLEN